MQQLEFIAYMTNDICNLNCKSCNNCAPIANYKNPFMSNFDKFKKNIKIINQLFETDDLYNKDVCDNTLYKQYRQNTPNSEYITHNSISIPIYTYMNIKELQNAVNDYNSLV